ncbi:hypothetical protein BD769DRAFT_1350019 [Suillus cothurnatus]|nr:hypothetical protein BD769DRAFT_1350019 [Suillus cothurnatus]
MPLPVTPPTTHVVLPSCPISPSKASSSFRITMGNEISDDTLTACTNLFSSNYGVWGQQASTISKHTIPGKHVKMTGARLRAQCLSHPEHTVLVTCYLQKRYLSYNFCKIHVLISYKLAGVTQLVVDKQVCQCYIATQLLQSLKLHVLFSRVYIVGLVSSHPAACNALAKYATADIKNIDLGFIHEHASGILGSSPISYLKAAQLTGALFEDNCNSGTISSVFTKFFVDHTEPLEVLSLYKKKDQWCLGELLDGHKFLAIFPITPMSSTVPLSPVTPTTS